MSAAAMAGIAPFLPLAGAVMIWLAGPRPNIREGVTLVTALLLLGSVAWVAPAVMNGLMDALAPLGVTAVDMPATPERLWRLIQDARQAQAAE